MNPTIHSSGVWKSGVPVMKVASQAKSCRVERLFGSSDHGPVTAVFEGPLFDLSELVEGPLQERPRLEDPPAAPPQLDLFGG
jgi:hypothetical protein